MVYFLCVLIFVVFFFFFQAEDGIRNYRVTRVQTWALPIYYSMKGRTSRYFQGEPLYAFGYGLSYTTFAYGKLDCPERAPANHDVPVSGEVRNTGKLDGEEVVQLYVKHGGVRPLEGFRRIALRLGEH